MRRDLLVSFALFLFTLLVFFQVRRFDFINTDDPQYVVENPHVRAGVTRADVAWAFTTSRMANWHPLTWLSHMADVQMFGMKPGAHHMTSAVIHAVNAALVYLVLVSLTRSPGKSGIVAALFALHPLRMESVAWVAERKDVLCALFFIIAVGCYGKYALTSGRERFVWYGGVIAAFVLGILSKPMIVTLPFVLLLLDCWPLKRPGRWELVVEKVPLFALALASALVTLIVQRAGGAVHTTPHLSLTLRIANAIWSYGRYIRKTVWPSDLAAYYPYFGVVPGTSLPWDKVVIAFVALVALSGVAIWLWRGRGERAALVGWLWFLGVMAPTIGLVQAGTQSMADRYTYLPHIGLFIALVWGVDAVAGQVRIATIVVAALAIVAFAGCTIYQLRYWRNSETLYTHALKVTDHNSIANRCIAMWLTEENRGDEALPFYQAAVQIDPDDAEAHKNLGSLLLERGQLAEALTHLETAIALQPRNADVHNNLANALAAGGRTDEALAHYQTAIELDPDLAPAYFNYAITLAQNGRIRQSLPLFARALQLQPDYAKAHYAYGLALAAEGDRAGALAHLRRALELRPDWPEVRGRIAWLQAGGASSRPATAP